MNALSLRPKTAKPRRPDGQKEFFMLTREDVLRGKISSRDIDPMSYPDLYRFAKQQEDKRRRLLPEGEESSSRSYPSPEASGHIRSETS